MTPDAPNVPDARLLLRAYAAGLFPMAESRDDPTLHWLDPKRRCIMPLDGFHISRRLRRTLKTHAGSVSFNRAFSEIVSECARPTPDRKESWINEPLRRLYDELHALGCAHSVEVWDETGALAGGLYGVALGAAFFGESMFSRKRDASKIALAHLVGRLRTAGFTLLDCQFMTPHLRSLGAVEISRAEYLQRLADALESAPRLMGDDTPAEMRGDSAPEAG